MQFHENLRGIGHIDIFDLEIDPTISHISKFSRAGPVANSDCSVAS
jgi:hypothetical protein